MTVALGIHCGHESSCSVVRDGLLVSAVQQERVTRRKYDGQEFLSDRLPIFQALALAGVTIEDCDVIVSSFQAAGPSAVGLQRPLFSKTFSAFDPFDRRHYVASHHLAHAASAAYASGFPEATVLVSDSAGTTSRDGRDFYQPFGDFFAIYTADSSDEVLFTEMRSTYKFANGRFELLERAFSQPHNQPDVYVQSEASLYDNVARYLFRREHAHGQLMALAGLPHDGPVRLSEADILTTEAAPRLRNGWQVFRGDADPTANVDVARAVQDAFTRLITYRAERAVSLADCPDLCCAGGVFLNLAANSAIADLSVVRDVYVPSCPHDAGISVGAAFLGHDRATRPNRAFSRCVGSSAPTVRVQSDFLGCDAEAVSPDHAASYGYQAVTGPGDRQSSAGRAAEVLVEGAVVARYAGRAEFGPRALGNRSVLCHPVTCGDAKAKLNRLKHRQGWRPVAPMVREEDLRTYFDGPSQSPFMNFNFVVRGEFQCELTEATHADGTARVQTVSREHNPNVYDLLTCVARLGHLPILINTSLNGPDQPIIDSADDVLEFARHPTVDYLLTDGCLYATSAPARTVVRRADSAVMAMFGSGSDARFVLSDDKSSCQVSRRLFVGLSEQEQVIVDRGSRQVLECLRAGLLLEV